MTHSCYVFVLCVSIYVHYPLQQSLETLKLHIVSFICAMSMSESLSAFNLYSAIIIMKHIYCTGYTMVSRLVGDVTVWCQTYNRKVQLHVGLISSGYCLLGLLTVRGQVNHLSI